MRRVFALLRTLPPLGRGGNDGLAIALYTSKGRVAASTRRGSGERAANAAAVRQVARAFRGD